MNAVVRAMAELMQALAAYAPKGTEHAAADAVGFAAMLGDLVEAHSSGSAVEQVCGHGPDERGDGRLSDAARELDPEPIRNRRPRCRTCSSWPRCCRHCCTG